MPSLPLVSGAEAVRALKTLGFVVARQRGSHIVMRKGSQVCSAKSQRNQNRHTWRFTQASWYIY